MACDAAPHVGPQRGGRSAMTRRMIAIGLGLAVATAAQQIPTIHVPVRLVTLPTLVFSVDKRLIPGLQASDFRVFDNGRLQTVTLDTSARQVSVALVVQMNQDV